MSRGTRDLRGLVSTTRRDSMEGDDDEPHDGGAVDELDGQINDKVARLIAIASADTALVGQLQSRVDDLQREVASQRARYEPLQRKFEAVSASHSDALKRLRLMDGEANDTQAELARLRGKCDAAESVNRALEERLRATEERGRGEGERGKAAEELIVALRTELQREQAARSVAEMALKEAEIARQRVQDAVEASERRRQAEAAEAQRERASLERDLLAVRQELSATQDESRRLQSDAAAQLKRLNDELDAARRGHDAMVSSLTDRLRGLEHAHAEQQAASHSGRTEAQALRAQLDSVSAELAEARRAGDALSDEHNGAMRELEDARGRLGEASTQVTTLRQQLSDAQRAAAMSQTAMAGEHDELRAANAKLHDDATRLKDEFRLHVRTQEDAHKSQLADKDAQIELLESRVAQGKRAAATASDKFDQDLRAQRQKLRVAEGEIETLNKRLQDAQREVDAAQANADSIAATAQAEREAMKARLGRLGKQETELQNATAKLLYAEEAMERELTCMACLNVFEEPVTCIPCGHVYCAKCTDGYEPECQTCDETPTTVVPNERLETLGGKVIFIKKAVAALKAMSAAAGADGGGAAAAQ